MFLDFHGELDVCVASVEVLEECVELLLVVFPDDQGVVDVAEPKFRLLWC